MKKLLLLILYGVVTYSVSAQQSVDSLKNMLSAADGTDRAAIFIQLAKTFTKSDSLQCLKYSREAIKIADRFDRKDLLANSYYQMGETYYYFDRYPLSISSYQNALVNFRMSGDSANVAECYNSIGLSYYYKGDYEIAIENFYKALRIFDHINNKDEEAHVYSNIAMVYSRVSDYWKAIANYRLASTINQSISDTGSLAVNYNGLGVGYYNLEEYDSAKVYYTRALYLFKKLGNQQRQAIALNNIANIYVNSGDSLFHALDYYQQAIKVFRELQDHRSEAFVLEGLGSVYRELGQTTQALNAFGESLQLSDKYKFGYYLMQLIYSDIALTYEKAGQVELAYQAYKRYNEYRDSLLLEERLDQVAELGEKYESEKKETEIQRLNALELVHRLQFQREKQFRIFGIVLIVLLMLITVLISLAYFNKRRTNLLLSQKNSQIEKQRQELEKLNASKNKFFSIIAHDLKNPFHTVMGYSYLMHKDYKRFNDEEREKYAGDIYKSTNTIFRLLQNLLDWSRSQTGRLNFNPQLFDFADLYENIFGLLKPVADAKKIELVSSIEEGQIAFADPMMVETILRNLINNAIKFTHTGGRVKTTVSIQNEKLLICVEDNGVGINPIDLGNLFRIDSKVKRKGTDSEDGSGLGLILCKEFVEKNGGALWAESQPGKGSHFWFTIPVYQND